MISSEFALQLLLVAATAGGIYAGVMKGVTEAILRATHAAEKAEKAEKAADHAHHRLDSHIEVHHVK